MYMQTWFEKAKLLNPGQSIFVSCSSSKEQTVVARSLRKLKEIYMDVDTQEAMSIQIGTMTKEGKLFVFLKKIMVTPTIGYLRDTTGELSKIDITQEIDRKRMIKLMLRDGLKKEDIIDNLGGLTAEEEKTYFPS
jgi:hypothetical protein